MKKIHLILVASAFFPTAIAACAGGGGMDMPPAASGPTETSSARPTEVDPNLHVTLPPSAATNGTMAGMPGMKPGAAAAGSGSMGPKGAGSTMPSMGKQGKPGAMGGMGAMGGTGAMGEMDGGAMDGGGMDGSMPMPMPTPMDGMQDAGMKPGCCGKMPMPKAPSQPPPMPMNPHGGGHM